MKKALVIANMMFASVTVFGLVPNDGRCDQQIGNHSNMKNMKDISPAKKIGSLWAEIIDGYEKFFNTINEDGNNTQNTDVYDETANGTGTSYHASTVGTLLDATSATIGAGSKVIAENGDITVHAGDTINSTVASGTLAVGLGGVGVGPSK